VGDLQTTQDEEAEGERSAGVIVGGVDSESDIPPVPISGTHSDTFSAFSICSLTLAIRSSGAPLVFFSLQL
jgi:hypothetical protein